MKKVVRPKSVSNILQFPVQEVPTEQERRAVRRGRAIVVAGSTEDDSVIDAILALGVADSDKVKLIPALLNLDTEYLRSVPIANSKRISFFPGIEKISKD